MGDTQNARPHSFETSGWVSPAPGVLPGALGASWRLRRRGGCGVVVAWAEAAGGGRSLRTGWRNGAVGH